MKDEVYLCKIFSKNDEGKKESEYIYDDSQNFILDFYLKLSGDKDHNISLILQN